MERLIQARDDSTGRFFKKQGNLKKELEAEPPEGRGDAFSQGSHAEQALTERKEAGSSARSKRRSGNAGVAERVEKRGKYRGQETRGKPMVGGVGGGGAGGGGRVS